MLKVERDESERHCFRSRVFGTNPTMQLCSNAKVVWTWCVKRCDEPVFPLLFQKERKLNRWFHSSNMIFIAFSFGQPKLKCLWISSVWWLRWFQLDGFQISFWKGFDQMFAHALHWAWVIPFSWCSLSWNHEGGNSFATFSRIHQERWFCQGLCTNEKNENHLFRFVHFFLTELWSVYLE